VALIQTLIGGPFAFPVAYAIVDFFERRAGLESGRYRHSGTGPVLGPAQLATLGVLAVVIVVALLGARHRHASSRSRSGALCASPALAAARNFRRGIPRRVRQKGNFYPNGPWFQLPAPGHRSWCQAATNVPSVSGITGLFLLRNNRGARCHRFIY
jgi:hypothetical protein